MNKVIFQLAAAARTPGEARAFLTRVARVAKFARGGVLRGRDVLRPSSGIKTRQAGFAQGLQWVGGNGLDSVLAGNRGNERTDRTYETDFAARAAGAFERDMAPVRVAMIEALQEGDLEALRGLRAMLPGLLADVLAEPSLADVLAEMIGGEVAERVEGGRIKNWGLGIENGGSGLADESALENRNDHRDNSSGQYTFGHGKGRSREHRTRGQDQFGHLPDENGNISEKNNMKRGFRVIQFLQQPGQRVEKAMFRGDVGAVGMEYGNPDHDTGWGNSHIESKHGKEALYKVPEIIQKGTLYRHDKEDRKRYLVYEGSILILKRVSGKQAWTVSSYEDSARIAKITKAKGETP